MQHVTTKASEEIVNPPSARITHQFHKIQPLIACLLDVRKPEKYQACCQKAVKALAEEAATTTEDGFAMFKQILVEESDELVCSERRVNYTWTKTKPSKLFLKNLKNLKNWWKKNKNW